MMTKLSNKADLLKLTEDLKDYFPGSLHAYGIVRNTAAGILDREVWVDAWPVFTGLVIKPGTTSPGCVKNSFHGDSFIAYKTPDSDPTGCTSLFRHDTILDWNSTLHFGGIDEDMRKVIENEADFHNSKTTIFAEVEMMVATAESLKETSIKLPKGFKDGSLRPEDMWFPVSRWKHAGDLGDAEEHVKYLVTQYQSVSLRLEADSSVLIGWGLVYSHGNVGMFYVEPEFRGQGLGKYLTQSLSKTVIDNGWPAFLNVESTNEVARNVYLKCGFRKTNINVHWFRCEPNN